MEIVRTFAYKNWTISLHCSRLGAAHFSSVGLVRELIPDKRPPPASTMIELTGRFFPTANLANDAVLAAAKRLIERSIRKQARRIS